MLFNRTNLLSCFKIDVLLSFYIQIARKFINFFYKLCDFSRILQFEVNNLQNRNITEYQKPSV